jgi:hypothetical protein
MKKHLIAAGALCALTVLAHARADERFLPPGMLIPGSGSGVASATVLFPAMRFPIEQGAAYANSHFYGVGGQRGAAGDSCDDANYAYPWRDNFCELRRADLPVCASGGHQGQDLRPATCRANFHWAVAADAGVIVQIGRFSVTLQTADGTLYRYVHLNTNDLAVQELQSVARGARIGKISNNWVDKLPIHLHFDVKDAVAIGERTEVLFVPPYTSLVQSYQQLTNQGKRDD